MASKRNPACVRRPSGLPHGAARGPGHHGWTPGRGRWANRLRFAEICPQEPPAPGLGCRLDRSIIDHYVLTSFLFYFMLLLVSFMLMTHVYTFFELLSDVLKNSIPMVVMAKYLLYLTPMLVYQSTPVSVLVAVLVTFGILTKNNEVTAMKACGVSLYRLAVPVFLATTVLSVGLFAFDYYVIPDANKTQDAIRNQIKGRPTQTYLDPNRKWIFGMGSSRIYYYKYFDALTASWWISTSMNSRRKPSSLKRHIFAERARWEPGLNTWIFQDGWSRDFKNGAETTEGSARSKARRRRSRNCRNRPATSSRK